jgi:membrane-bound lytic murein transglycosylase B
MAQSKIKASPIREDVYSKYDFLSQEAVQNFIARMVSEHGFNESELKRAFSAAKHRAQAKRLMDPPAVTFRRSWETYRGRYLDEFRVRQGLQFWQENKTAIEAASAKFGVPQEVIVAIIGVETVYGRVTGDFRVIDVLATLAFDYPRRENFFRQELEQFLLLARDQNWDLMSIKGSFAGAIGYPQFMPGSIRRHAIDFSGDNRIDLLASPADAVGSVANFFVNHGWIAGQLSYQNVVVSDPARVQELVSQGIQPAFTRSQLEERGVTFAPRETIPSVTLSPAGQAPTVDPLLYALIEFPTPNKPSEWIAATSNFYTVTRYNQSSFYALAVLHLAEALKALPRENTGR